MKHLARFLTAFFLALLAPSAFAQAVAYDNIDQATVRVLGMGNVEIEPIEDEGQTYHLAVPIAGHGSGVLLSKDGLILTAAHVIDDTRALAVLVPGHLGPLPAVTVYKDTTRDFALLRVGGDFEHVAELADPKAKLAIRQNVFAIGYPLDATRTDPQSTPGIVSGVRPSGQLQLGMSVNPGNSGGPVVDSDGKVRAIVVSRSRLDEGAVGLAYAVPLSTFADSVTKQLATPPDAAQRAYLEADTSRRLADLTSLMSLYGLEVMRTSLSKSEMDVDPRIKGALDEASEGAHASTDGRLLSAVFYWNQSLVMRRRGDTKWPGAQAKAVSLVREAAKAEPTLQTKSEFVKLLLSLAPAPPQGANPPGQAPNPSYGAVNLQPPPDRGPSELPDRPRQRRKRTWLLLEAGPDYSFVDVDWTDEDNSGARELNARGVGLAMSVGAHIRTSSFVAMDVGANFSFAELPLDCSECANDAIDPGDTWTQLYFGAFFGVQLKYFTLGTRLNNVDASSNGDVQPFKGWVLGWYGGPSFTSDRFGVAALAEYNSMSATNEHGSSDYTNVDFRLLGQLLF
ncbi:MAG: trypsin-like peptidase domain-containing protein [Myxococcales bacterium]|nr:trypsin-like peptidase domain-containing protein [Myxococcales bacterium]